MTDRQASMTSTEYTDLAGLIAVEKNQDTLKKIVLMAQSQIRILSLKRAEYILSR